MKYKLGTKDNKFSLKQAESVIKKLNSTFPNHSFELIAVKDTLEEQLINNKLDLAIFDMQTIPEDLPQELTLTDYFIKEDNRSVMILSGVKTFEDLPKGAVIATYPGIDKQLKLLRPDLKVTCVKENIESYIDHSNYAGVIIPIAELTIDPSCFFTHYFSTEEIIPAIHQSTIGLVMHKDHSFIHEINGAKDIPLYKVVKSEQNLIKEIEKDQETIICANASYYDKKLYLDALYHDTVIHVTGTMPEDTVHAAIRKLNSQRYGEVTLVGAGPGDPDLLTIKAIKTMKQAECIMYDAYLGKEIQDYIPDDIDVVVINSSPDKLLTQNEVNELLFEKAKKYNRVVHLKMGDTFVFGNGVEELRYLKDKGIRYSIVNGISSIQTATSAYAIPLTIPGIATGFICVNGQKPEKLDYSYLADTNDTILIVMGLKKLDSICHGLVNAGKNKTIPVAVVNNATRPDQKVILGTLEDIRFRVVDQDLNEQAVIIIGQVVTESYLY